ncbi:MAG: DUF1640 domain-containing protein [Magnetovibrio sp.]|nr:DUF1640 domain-containing protein [Magnetovibrio sp.]
MACFAYIPRMSITFDKLAYVEHLKAGGFTEQQAKTQAEALDTAFKESVATQHDIDLPRRDIKEMEQRITIRLGGMIVAATAFPAAIKFFS